MVFSVIFVSMSLNSLLEGFIIGIVVSIPLGPLGILCIQRTVNKTWKSGFISGLGIATSDTFYAIVAGFSLTIIIDFLRQYEIYFKILGACMVMLLGLYIFHSNPAKDIQKFRKKGNSYFQDYVTAVLLTLSNPLAVFVFLAIFTTYSVVLQMSHLFDAFLIIGGIYLGASTWWFGLTGTAYLFKHKLTINTIWWANKIFGIIVILFAVVLFIYFQFAKI
jgi:threonine/homoserine/homoserine lactone efflux protein